MQPNNPKLAGFDWRGFAASVEQKRRSENLSVRALAGLLGLTGKDISMAGGGHVVGVAKVHALIRWLDFPLDHFDILPCDDATESTCYGRAHVKHESLASRAEGAPASQSNGPRIGSDGQSPLRPLAGNLHELHREGR